MTSLPRSPRFVQSPTKRQPLSTKQTAQVVIVVLLVFYAVGVLAQRISQ